MQHKIEFKHDAFKKIPTTEYFRFVIDLAQQTNPEELGFLAYEQRERGSVKSKNAILLKNIFFISENSTGFITEENKTKLIAAFPDSEDAIDSLLTTQATISRYTPLNTKHQPTYRHQNIFPVNSPTN